jgi:hypothetical protein
MEEKLEKLIDMLLKKIEAKEVEVFYPDTVRCFKKTYYDDYFHDSLWIFLFTDLSWVRPDGFITEPRKLWEFLYTFFTNIPRGRIETKKYNEYNFPVLVVPEEKYKECRFFKLLFGNNIFLPEEISEDQLRKCKEGKYWEYDLIKEGGFQDSSYQEIMPYTYYLFYLLTLPDELIEPIFKFANLEKLEENEKELLKKKGLFEERKSILGDSFLNPTNEDIIDLVLWIRKSNFSKEMFQSYVKKIEETFPDIYEKIKRMKDSAKPAKNLQKMLVGYSSTLNFSNFLIEDFLGKRGVPYVGFPFKTVIVKTFCSEFLGGKKRGSVSFQFKVKTTKGKEIYILTKVLSRPLLKELPILIAKLIACRFRIITEKEKEEKLELNEKMKICVLFDSDTYEYKGDPYFWLKEFEKVGLYAFSTKSFGIYTPGERKEVNWCFFDRLQDYLK